VKELRSIILEFEFSVTCGQPKHDSNQKVSDVVLKILRAAPFTGIVLEL
jgi:hypothetical protein